MKTYSKWPVFSKKEINITSIILKSGKVNYWTGKYNIEFEKNFSSYIGNKYSITVSNGSVALEIALKSLGIKKNDKIIVTPKSYFISAACVVNINAKPIFVDIDPNTQNISVDSLKKIASKNMKAIICVHLGGQPCEMSKILKICKKYHIKVIEDCSQAHGARIDNKKVGSFGNAAIWSFCNDKIISTGEGGMISTNYKSIWKKAWSIKEGGRDYDQIFNKKNKTIGFKWIHNHFGTNNRMTEIQAAIGNLQLKKLDGWVKLRNKNANMLINNLKKYNFITFQNSSKNILNSYYRLYVFIDTTKVNRNFLLSRLNKLGVPCDVGSCSEIYLEKSFKNIYRKTRLKNASASSKNSIAFKVHPSLKVAEIRDINKKISKVFDNI